MGPQMYIKPTSNSYLVHIQIYINCVLSNSMGPQMDLKPTSISWFQIFSHIYILLVLQKLTEITYLLRMTFKMIS
jgi:hypothetical protein